MDKAIQSAKDSGRYLVTVSYYIDDNHITHKTFVKDFNTEEIASTLDHCASEILGGKEPIVEEKKEEEPAPLVGKKLKIAIISHSENVIDTYSISTAIKNQIEMLQNHGHDVTYFGRALNSYGFCKVERVMPDFKREKNVVNDEAKDKMIEVFREHLPNYDVAITHDFCIDDCSTHRKAIMECGVDIPWLHFIRSGLGHSVDFAMPNATYVGLNKVDLPKYADKIGVGMEQMATVYNIKDPLIFHKMQDKTAEVVEKMKLWEKDIVQVYPFCITRADAKGVNHLIKLFAELKKTRKVGLIFCEANNRDNIKEQKQKLANALGLEEDEFMFTGEVPQKVVGELMQLSNLFVFPSTAETCGQVMLEAAMGKNLIVINDQVATLSDFMPKDVIRHNFNNPDYKELADMVKIRLDNNTIDKTFRHVWRNHNVEAVYKQLEKLLYAN